SQIRFPHKAQASTCRRQDVDHLPLCTGQGFTSQGENLGHAVLKCHGPQAVQGNCLHLGPCLLQCGEQRGRPCTNQDHRPSCQPVPDNALAELQPRLGGKVQFSLENGQLGVIFPETFFQF